jgi:F-type H+-transporting ATPase subunit epsilon
MRDNKATILADAAEHVDEIDIPRAEEAMRRAEERIRMTDASTDLKRALHSQRRAALRLKIARGRRGTGVPSVRA